MRITIGAVAFVVLGSAGVSAWAQVNAHVANRGSSSGASSPVETWFVPSIGIGETMVRPSHDSKRRSLENNPYGDAPASSPELAKRIDDENPYPDGARASKAPPVDPYLGAPDVGDCRRKPLFIAQDFANPYDPVMTARVELDPENPYLASNTR